MTNVSAAVLDQLWVVVCGGNRLFVKTPKARQLLRELAHGDAQAVACPSPHVLTQLRACSHGAALL